MSDWHSQETYKSMIQISISALKAPMLINGGAVIALLSLVGATSDSNNPILNVEAPIQYFIAGIVLSAVAYCFSYLTQLALYNESVGGHERHHWWLYSSMACVVFSITLFAMGSLYAASLIEATAAIEAALNSC